MTDPTQMIFREGQKALHLVKQTDPSPSHWGGVPSVPAGWQWPMRENGAALSFLGQLDLAQVHAALPMAHLPSSGTLLFFYDTEDQPWGFDPADRDGWKVEYFPAGTTLAPAADTGGVEPWPLCPLGMRVIETYEEGCPTIEGDVELDDDAIDSLHEFVAEHNFQAFPHHQVGGYPDPVQNPDMGAECELASHRVWVGSPDGYNSEQGQALLNAGGAKAWKLVLQVDTDEDDAGPGWMWGDTGMLYFWVKEDAGRAGDFSNAWLVLQCC